VRGLAIMAAALVLSFTALWNIGEVFNACLDYTES